MCNGEAALECIEGDVYDESNDLGDCCHSNDICELEGVPLGIPIDFQ